MTTEIPGKWLKYLEVLPPLSKTVHWDLLRQWSMSEVWRISLNTGESLIAKWGAESMAGELKIYESILVPLDVPRPKIHAKYIDNTSNVIVMEDLGKTTVELAPTIENFTHAAGKLAKIRQLARHKINEGKLSPSTFKLNYKTHHQFIEDLHYVLKSTTLSAKESHILRAAMECLPNHLEYLYKTFPVTLTHNDYNTKNLMVVRNSVIPIDWSNAYLSPHLGDLYCLLSEAEEYGLERQKVIRAYQEYDKSESMDWQIQIGGLCWEIQGLRWVCEEGVHKVPGTDEWIPMMIKDIHDCLEQLNA